LNNKVSQGSVATCIGVMGSLVTAFDQFWARRWKNFENGRVVGKNTCLLYAAMKRVWQTWQTYMHTCKHSYVVHSWSPNHIIRLLSTHMINSLAN